MRRCRRGVMGNPRHGPSALHWRTRVGSMRALAAQRKSKSRRVTNPDETPQRPCPPQSGLVQHLIRARTALPIPARARHNTGLSFLFRRFLFVPGRSPPAGPPFAAEPFVPREGASRALGSRTPPGHPSGDCTTAPWQLRQAYFGRRVTITWYCAGTTSSRFGFSGGQILSRGQFFKLRKKRHDPVRAILSRGRMG